MRPRELVSEIRRSIYAVLIEWAAPPDGTPKVQAVGTAFAISSEGHFMTAEHVVNQVGQPLTTQDKILLAQMQPDGLTASISGPYSILTSSKTHDYALLHQPTAQGRVQQYLDLDSGSRFEGEDVAICGYPMASSRINPENKTVTIELNIRVAAGIISSQKLEHTGRKLLEVDFPILPGNSGGPLVSLKTGKVLGLAIATMAVGEPGKPTLGHLGLVSDIRNAASDLRTHIPHL